MNKECDCNTADNVDSILENSYASRNLASIAGSSAAGKLGLNALDLAWAAGFADGEACISVVWQRYNFSPRRATVRIRLQIVQNHLPVLIRLKNILDVKSTIHEMKRLVGHNRQIYTLNIDGENALCAILKLLPYLFRKKEEADVLIAAIGPCYFGVRPGRHGYPEHVWTAREKLVKKLQKLK
jgi:hypothetical protein